MDFVHLKLHTEYSMVDGLVRVGSLVDQVVAEGMPAVAITDQSNLCALVKFQQAAPGAGIKPIFGADLLVSHPASAEPSRITLLAQNRTGYAHLTELISRGYLEGQRQGRAVVEREWVLAASEGLIALSGGPEGEVGGALVAGHEVAAGEYLADWMNAFPNRFYLEVRRTGRAGEEACLHASVALAERSGCPLVATNDVRFLRADDYEAHETRVCIHESRTLDDPRRPRHYSEQQYLKSPQEMAALFSDIPEAVTNTVEIAKRCNLQVELGKVSLPDYPIPEGMTMEAFFRAESEKGLEARLARILDPEQADYQARRAAYFERLDDELRIINEMGFPGYFLIVMDFIQWAKNNAVPVGPGRGSGAGSLVAYALQITNLDPLQYDLLFERFLNPERVSMPDFDVDFCMEGRDRVIEYVSEKYGRDAVGQIITFGAMMARAVVRDVARAQGKSYGFADKIAKLIPSDPGMTLEKAFQQEDQLQELYDADEDVSELIDMSLKLEGITRNAGKHAGGVVIAPSKLTDFAPLHCDENGENVVTQFDKDDVEEAGLVKFDFLGLRTLTIVDWAVETLNEARAARGEALLDIDRIPLDDAESFRTLKAAKTTAVFQLESRGMKELIQRLEPASFEEIIALVALFRPGPLNSGMADDFVNRKHGRAEVTYPHPKLEPVLNNTYGVILYQEQVMQIAQVLAGYTLGQADMLRRAMGKKKAKEMARQRQIFTEGAVANGVDETKATEIFDIMEKFAEYGFNKSHSAAYALVSYQTLWLKTHYPAAFMAATLSADMHNTDKIVPLIDECQTMGLTIVPPDVNRSEYRFTVDAEERVVYGLGAVRGVGEGPIEAILSARRDEGAFEDLFDFCHRIGPAKVNRRTLEALIKAGALDALGPNRAVLLASLEEALKAAEQRLSNESAGISDLFGSLDGGESLKGRFQQAALWDDDERLQGEKETLGLYLTGHPIDQYEAELAHFVTARIHQVHERRDNAVIAGQLVALKVTKTKRGDKVAFATLDDRTGRLEMSVFPEAYEQFRSFLLKDNLIVAEGEIQIDDFSGQHKLVARRILSLTEAREAYAKQLRLNLSSEGLSEDFPSRLAEALAPYRDGACSVAVDYRRPDSEVRLVFGESWRVSPKEELVSQLRAQYGRDAVTVVYR